MKRAISAFVIFITAFAAVGCGSSGEPQSAINSMSESSENNGGSNTDTMDDTPAVSDIITLTPEITELESGLSAVSFDGETGFDEFLKNGGSSSDAEVVQFLAEKLSADGLSFSGEPFGCSTISVKNGDGGYLFGRNFDWNKCNAMIVRSAPQNGYASISTVNTDFISGIDISHVSDGARAMIALYAPLDGMNEKGLAVSVNMIQDSAAVSQNTDKPDITTTTAVRLLLDKAANVDEATALLSEYDMHASKGFTVHFALADNSGKSVVVEYVNNEMLVTETPVVTNFYLAEGEKYGIGTEQSHERYDILMKALADAPEMDMSDVRDALGSVSKGNFGEFESTEWSIVFNQSTGEVYYYHRENYDKRYTFKIKGGDE